MKYIFFALAFVAFATTGCTRGPNGLPVLKTPGSTQTQPVTNTVKENTPPVGQTYTPAPSKIEKSKPVTKPKKTKYKRPKKTTHKLKPEPYSIGSGKKDPELLGPQTTIKREPKIINKENSPVPNIEETDLTKNATKSPKVTTVGKKYSPNMDTKPKAAAVVKSPEVVKAPEVAKSPEVVTKKEPVKAATEVVEKKEAAMTKSSCIKMIGDSKFQDYTKRFGGESGAIKRCSILRRLKRG